MDPDDARPEDGRRDGADAENARVDRRFEALMRAVLDGSSSPDERAELGQLIADNGRLADEYASQFSIHSLLEWQSEDVTSDLVAFNIAQVFDREAEVGDQEALTRDEDRQVRRQQAGSPRDARSPRQATRVGKWAAAAALLAGIGAAGWGVTRIGWADYMAVATIVEQEGVSWTDDSSALGRGGRIFPGRLKNRAGSFTLQFHSGARLHVVGAAALNIESPMVVSLDRGQMTAHVTEASRGFTLKTPVADVVDLGTEFGVDVSARGHADVVVFEGQVAVDNKRTSWRRPMQLEQGEAVRIGPQGVVERLMQIQRDAQGAWWSMSHPDFADNIIAEVRDNLPIEDGAKRFCYQITVHGLEDDAFAYVDHLHQWNGLTARGLPKFLQGAEYVKTFNDYRYLVDFEMTIKLARPANLYVFFDNRVPIPDWLPAQFEDTGVDIGLDEGYHREVPDHVVAVGGGNSIDIDFSVWRRRYAEPTTVTLGPVGDSPEARAMYGVAATPLEADGIIGFLKDESKATN
jgi:hypothetical protein